MDLSINFSSLNNNNKDLKKPTHKKQKSIRNLAKTEGKITSKDIQQSLNLRFLNHQFILKNIYFFNNWESDFLSVTDSDYIYEVEIKVTKSDFKDDFNKKDKHILLENHVPDQFQNLPNKFFYACPQGMLYTHEVPEYAGLIEISSRNEPAIVIKEAPFLHREKIDYHEKLLKKVYGRYKSLLFELENSGKEILFSEEK